MRGLLVKDFRQLMQQKKSLIMIVVLALILNLNMDGGFIFGYLTFIGAFLVMNTMSYDEYDNTLPFLFTLPVKRETYAAEKYVFGILLCGLGWFLALVTSLLQTMAGKGMSMDTLVKGCPVYIPMFLMMLALIIPFPLIYGREKGSIMMMVIVGVIVALGFLADHLLEKRGLSIGKWLDSMSGLTLGSMTLVLFAVGIEAIVISMLVSVNYMKKKEL